MTGAVVVDIQAATQAFLQSQIPTARVVTELPNTLEANLPVIQVFPLGGPLHGPFSDASITIHCFVAKGQDAIGLALQVVQAMKMVFPKTPTLGVSVVSVKVNSLPQFWDYDNPNVRRTVTLFDVRCHAG